MRENEYPADILQNPQRFSPNFTLFHSTLSHFTPRNSLIFISSDRSMSHVRKVEQHFEKVRQDIQTSQVNFLPVIPPDTKEPIYSTIFSIYAIPSLLNQHWSSSSDIKNVYLAKVHMSKLPKPVMSTIVPRSTPSTPKLLSNKTLKVWFPSHAVSDSPLVTLRCEFRSKNANPVPAWSGKHQHWVLMLL